MNFLSNIHIRRKNIEYSLYIFKFYAVLFNFLYLIHLSRGNCTLSEPSSASSAKEEALLRILRPLQGHRFETQDGHYLYHVQICGPVVDGKVSDDVGAIQYELPDRKLSHALGKYTSVEVIGGTDWIFLYYNDGDKYKSKCNQTSRVTMIMIVCDPAHYMGELRIIEERTKTEDDNCFYLFELGSGVVCSNSSVVVLPSPGLSSGGVFCIIFFTVASIYLLIGFLYQRIVVGAKGLEQIPNYAFWRSFGNLQADGCDYICRCGPRQESQAYRGIDDRIRTDEERDDQLLNM